MFIYFQITEVGKDVLPSWLTFNELKTELKGIPGPEDKGHIYLEVKVSGDGNSQSDDVFSIEVRDDTNGPVTSVQSLDENAPKVIRCKREEPQTIVTVVVDCDLYRMKPGMKMNILNNMAGHLNLAPEMLKLMPVGNKPMFDIGALVVGPGNVKVPKTAGSLVSWNVGCGQVDDNHVSTLQQMESAAANGDLTSAVGHDIIGWHVTNTRFQAKPRRRRRATPTPTMAPPTPTTVIAATSTKHVATSTVLITPTKSIQVKPTAMPGNKDKTTSSSVTIAPSSSKKMTLPLAAATEMLPTKAYTMTTSSKTKTKIVPSTTRTTTSSTIAKKPTTPEPTTASTTERNTKKPKPKPTSEPLCPKHGVKKPPMVKNKLRNIHIPSGTINRKKLAEDTFYDCYNNITSNLDLEITFSNGESLPDGFWLKVHKRAFRPYILLINPLTNDAGSYTFTLTATNFYSKSTSQNFVVIVEGEDMASSPPSHELSMSIDTNYDRFMSSLDNRIELSNKVSRIFGDKNANSLTVTRLEEGSVIYAWTNHSLAGSDCPTDDLKALVNKMFNKDGTLTENAQDALQPYKVNSAAAHPLGACTNNPDFPSRMTKRVRLTTEKPMTTKDKTSPTIEPSIKIIDIPKTTPKMMPKSSSGSASETTTVAIAAAGAGGGGSDIWITTVVPAIVVVIVLIIALIIACCLYRKRRKGKMKLEEKEKFSNNKGVPVIFADEYEEKPNDSTRPLILEDEKPPMPPPEYQRASSESSGNSNSTQPIEDKYIEEIEMEDGSELSPLYSPPPPVTASNNSKPPHVQSSRGPPPYVPP